MTIYDPNKFKNENLSLWYKGIFEDNITENLIDIVESDQSLGKSKRKISFLMAESFQNIVRHGLRDHQNSIEGFFGVTNQSNTLSIFSSNLIERKTGKELSEKFQTINKLNSDELKELYRKVLTERNFSDKGGAGLGLIEMARKSGQPIQFHFEDAGQKSEFSMQIDKSLSDDNKSPMKIEEGLNLHKEFKSHGTLLFYKGDFDSETTNNIVKMLSENTDITNNSAKIVFHAGVELLQNVSRHAQVSNSGKRESAFSVALQENEVIISSFNFINNEKKKELESHLNNISNKSTEQLKQLYKETLKKNVLNDSKNAGVGLIDIAKYGAKIKSTYHETHLGEHVELEVRINHKN